MGLDWMIVPVTLLPVLPFPDRWLSPSLLDRLPAHEPMKVKRAQTSVCRNLFRSVGFKPSYSYPRP